MEKKNIESGEILLEVKNLKKYYFFKPEQKKG